MIALEFKIIPTPSGIVLGVRNAGDEVAVDVVGVVVGANPTLCAVLRVAFGSRREWAEDDAQALEIPLADRLYPGVMVVREVPGHGVDELNLDAASAVLFTTNGRGETMRTTVLPRSSKDSRPADR